MVASSRGDWRKSEEEEEEEEADEEDQTADDVLYVRCMKCEATGEVKGGTTGCSDKDPTQGRVFVPSRVQYSSRGTRPQPVYGTRDVSFFTE
jgi:hypothetical protein